MSSLRRLICGGAAGITSVVFTYPLDIVRTRLSIQSASFAGLKASSPTAKLPGMLATLITMYKTEGGVRALYRGIIPTVAGVAPYVCLSPYTMKLLLIEYLGGPQFHDLRSRTNVLYTRRRQEPKCSPKACCWSYLRSSSADLHLSFVSHINDYTNTKLTDF